jgi:hypothetical protein
MCVRTCVTVRGWVSKARQRTRQFAYTNKMSSTKRGI